MHLEDENSSNRKEAVVTYARRGSKKSQDVNWVFTEMKPI
jgi:hypothetical protein